MKKVKQPKYKKVPVFYKHTFKDGYITIDVTLEKPRKLIGDYNNGSVILTETQHEFAIKDLKKELIKKDNSKHKKKVLNLIDVKKN